MKDKEANMKKTNLAFVPLILAGGVAVFLLGIVIYIPLLIAGLIL